MNDWLTGGLAAGLAGVLVFYHWLSEGRRRKQAEAADMPVGDRRFLLLPFLLEYAACMLLIYLHLPLPAAYFLFYASCFLRLRRAYGASLRNTLFVSNLVVIHLYLMNMALLSVASLLRGTSVLRVLGDPVWCAAVLLLTMVGMVISFYIQNGLNVWKNDGLLSNESERVRQLRIFVWFALGFALFDSVPCVFDLSSPLLSCFLLGSCLLLGLVLYLVWVHAMRVERNLHYEEEYRQLEEERARQLQKEMELHRIAYVDGLTGTYTRQYILQTLQRWIAENRPFTLVYIDLDGLKGINDRLGHPAGDAYIQGVTGRINRALCKQDLFARIGGDEFLIALPSLQEEPSRQKMQEIREEVERANASAYTASFSFGVVERKAGSSTPLKELLREADACMYHDKKRGR